MSSTLRKFLVVFLTLLQFIAPLVHAHANETGAGQGLHVPGLEYYGGGDDRTQALQYHVSMDGVIVGIDTGLKQNRANFQADPGNDYYLPQHTAAFNADAVAPGGYFSVRSQQPACRRFLISPFPPRAPPAR
jgi:hypothetical protein